MQLRKLQLSGFKTFAEKTEIEIGDGLTAVVGPNGSGKSNIADAILWVMGEQNPRLLRGSEARDVIFSGTDKRKPLGMAEVRLTVDNSDHSLPVDFAEVTITRRVYRSGESQYLLNNAPCRMKDIVELFLDTGVGKGAYSFVSQSEIDAVLSARAEDRRELFEEAAGIKKYRVKKREAVRKLDQAEANLTRVRDIIHELEGQREPLAEQAEEARRYRQLTERLQEIEVDLLVDEVQKTDYEIYAARTDQELDRETIAKYDADLGRLEHESTEIGARLARAEEDADSARISHQSALTTQERTESRLQLILERGTSAEQSAESLEIELKEIAARISAITTDLAAQEKAAEKAATAEEKLRASFTTAKAHLAEIDTSLAELRKNSADRQAVLLRMAEQRAQREAAVESGRARVADLTQRQIALDTELQTAKSIAKESATHAAQTSAAAATARKQLEAASKTAADMEERRRALRSQQAQAVDALDAGRRKLAERQTRLATLNELQESGEGFYQGVRAVLKAAKEKMLRGSYTPAVDLLTVPEQLRVAVEVALGGSLQDIVCETEGEAKSAIQWLKSERAGRATFLALPSLRPAPSIPSKSVAGLSGILGVGSDLVTADKRYAEVLQLLLGRVVVAESMDAALAASKKLQGWSRIVTVEGELVTPGGALTGGSLQGRGAHLVGRKGEIDDLTASIPALQTEVQKLERSSEEAAKSLTTLEAELAEAARSSSELQANLARAESESASAAREQTRLESALKDLQAEAKSVGDRITAARAELSQWEAAAAQAETDDSDVDQAVADAAAKVTRLEAERESAAREAVRLEVELGRIVEQRSSAQRSRDANIRLMRDLELTRETKQTQRELAGSRMAEAGNLEQELRLNLAAAKEHLERCQAQMESSVAAVQSLRAESFEKAGAIKQTSSRRAEVLQEMHDAELQIARLEVRLSQASQRLIDEYGISREEALALPAPEQLEKATVTEISRLRREIRSMGSVNTGAVEEYERLTERHDFLAEQRQDLEKARESLLATIAEIDESTRDIFMETFNAVSVEFSRIFQQLFGGGTTRLTLTSPDDLLETGIEVIAHPPGKKAQHLSLLSGGERALTAVALMFSFLAVRPSPFCLLDEVDAPLDGPNVEKFVGLVREFSRRTQFLVITHNPTTMESAPRWYGVTMQEPGISRILSYRVPESAIASESEAVVYDTRELVAHA